MKKNIVVEITELTHKTISPGGAVKKALENISVSFEKGIISSIYSENKLSSAVLLKAISGVIAYDSGSIISDGEIIYIPAEASSFPWLTVKENILFGVEHKSDEELKNVIESVGLEGYEDHHCDNKSLGFRFRIALGRALIRKPAAIAVDDVFAKMEKRAKYEILQLLVKLNKKTEQTFIIACSDMKAALFAAEKFYTLNENCELSSGVEISFGAERSEALTSTEEFADAVKKILLSNKL